MREAALVTMRNMLFGADLALIPPLLVDTVPRA
jgi:hypothetical protein